MGCLWLECGLPVAGMWVACGWTGNHNKQSEIAHEKEEKQTLMGFEPRLTIQCRFEWREMNE